MARSCEATPARSVGPWCTVRTLAARFSFSSDLTAVWSCTYDDSLGNSAVFTDVMVGGPAMGDEQAQEGGYNASLQNRAEAAARGDIAKPDASGLMVVGPLMSSLALRQVRLYFRIDRSCLSLGCTNRTPRALRDSQTQMDGLVACACRVASRTRSAPRRVWSGGLLSCNVHRSYQASTAWAEKSFLS